MITSSTNWKILSALSNKALTTNELAAQIGMSASNTLKHLKILEAKNLIEKRDKYMLKKEFALIALITKGCVEKKIIKLNSETKKILKQVIGTSVDNKVPQYELGPQ